MASISSIKLPNGVTYDLKDNGALQLTGGQVTGPVTFGDSVSIDSLTAGDLVVNGSASFTNNISANTINGVQVGSSPKFTDTTYTNLKLGQGVGTCNTATSTVAKVVSLSGFQLQKGGVVAVRFTNQCTNIKTLNVNSTGAKYIKFGAHVTSESLSVLLPGTKTYSTLSFMYDGTNYVYLGLSASLATTSFDGYMSSEDKTKLDSLTITNGVIDASNLPSYVNDVADFVISQSFAGDVSNTWSWRKWNSGTYELWYTYDESNVSGWTNSGITNVYYKLFTVDLPSDVVTVFSADASFRFGSGLNWVSAVGIPSYSQITFYVMRNSNNTERLQVCVKVYGTWK